MLRGSVEAKIDEKGRLKIPSDFRKVIEESWGRDLFVTAERGDFGLLYPLPVWEQLEERLAKVPGSDLTRRAYLRRVGYFGQQVRFDAQGRLVLKPKLRETAAIDGEVVVFGALDHLEVWNRERFERQLEEHPLTDADYEQLRERGI